ncbi:AAA family ATPase [Acinetobacter seifertii]|uniref:AAA family ATPase n=1 Tax=Acinetobacter seifertii TaxID=1530123 RepID=UPI00124E33F2|nr:AAA family ATPase [Acinetobacter seifertii]
MYVKKLQVEDGFLNNLNINFERGLNTIIGARGTGKTSIIELIRYCLGVESTSKELTKKIIEHVGSILAEGSVALTLADEKSSEELNINKTFGYELNSEYNLKDYVIIFSQTEIENIGMEASGRLGLIDGFIPNKKNYIQNENEVKNEFKILYKRIKEVENIVDDLNQKIKNKEAVNNEIKELKDKVNSSMMMTDELKIKTAQLESLSNKLSDFKVNYENVVRSKNKVYEWYELIYKAVNFDLQDSDIQSRKYDNNILIKNSVNSELKKALDFSADLWRNFDNEEKDLNTEIKAQEDFNRNLRMQINNIESGLGNQMLKMQHLTGQKATIEANEENLRIQEQLLDQLKMQKKILLDKLEINRNNLYLERKKVVDYLNTELQPSIYIDIKRNKASNLFSTMLADLLKGSSLKYNESIPQIYSTLTPRVFVDCVESNNVNLVSTIAGLSIERVLRIFGYLKERDLSDLYTLMLEDDIDMFLLDGSTYKNISILSTGQRCTIILPIILSHSDKIIIVDQPEDHIDNAFITSTLIKSLKNNKNNQIVFSTHNPNIPVLGEAINVIHLESDGVNGYVKASGSLYDIEIIDSISTVMEGGKAAFAKRAEFYRVES